MSASNYEHPGHVVDQFAGEAPDGVGVAAGHPLVRLDDEGRVVGYYEYAFPEDEQSELVRMAEGLLRSAGWLATQCVDVAMAVRSRWQPSRQLAQRQQAVRPSQSTAGRNSSSQRPRRPVRSSTGRGAPVTLDTPESEQEERPFGAIQWPQPAPERVAALHARAADDVHAWEVRWLAASSGLRPAANKTLRGMFAAASTIHLRAVQAPERAVWLPLSPQERLQRERLAYQDGREWIEEWWQIGIGRHTFEQVLAHERFLRADTPGIEELKTLITRAKHLFLGAIAFVEGPQKPVPSFEQKQAYCLQDYQDIHCKLLAQRTSAIEGLMRVQDGVAGRALIAPEDLGRLNAYFRSSDESPDEVRARAVQAALAHLRTWACISPSEQRAIEQVLELL